MKFALLFLRVTIGGLFFGHGMQKLLGWFGGHGLDATAQAFHGMGMRPGRRNAIAAGLAEAGGGAGIALGLGTPLAASALTATMLTAIDKVHGQNGPWVTSGGYEYNLVLIAGSLALAEAGPGPISLDSVLGIERKGTGWALTALGAGVLGAAGAHLLAASTKEEPPAPPAYASDNGVVQDAAVTEASA